MGGEDVFGDAVAILSCRPCLGVYGIRSHVFASMVDYNGYDAKETEQKIAIDHLQMHELSIIIGLMCLEDFWSKRQDIQFSSSRTLAFSSG